MENATKALLMAAGILIAIIILSLAIVVYGRVTSYYQTKQRNISQEQLAAFNNEYTVYNRDDVTGFELVSLINKCIDFNQNEVYGASNTDDDTAQRQGYSEIQVDVVIPSGVSTISYYGDDRDYSSLGLFKSDTYYYNGKNSGTRKDLADKIKSMQTIEKNYAPSDLTKLTTYISEINNREKTVQEIIGKNYNITIENIVKYADYLTFKRGIFECIEMKYDKYGQINYFKFEQTK